MRIFHVKLPALAFCIWTIALPVQANNSLVNIPVHNWVYDGLSRLARTGLISSSFLSMKPIRRDAAARLVTQAIENYSKRERKTPSGFDWTEELLHRLEREFQRELKTEDGSPILRSQLIDTVELETIGVELEDQSGVQNLENSSGRSVSEGLNTRLLMRGWVQSGNYLGLALGVETRSQELDQDLILMEGSLNLNLVFLDLEAGRDRLWWGPGEHGALLLSDNAPPFDLIKIGNPHPSRFPFMFSRLGEWKWSIFLTRLEQNRVHSRVKLGGARLVWVPFGWLELGISRTVMFGGSGAPNFTLADFGRLLVGTGQDDDGSRFVGNNNLAAWDATLYLPSISSIFPIVHGTKLYLEYGGEENTPNRFLGKQYKRLAAIAILAGLSISFARADIGLEYANSVDDGLTWYDHWFYDTGYTFNGSIIGHEMGGDADDLSIHATVYLTPKLHLYSFIERERMGINFNPENVQIVYAGQVDLKYSLLPKWEASVGYRYENIIRPEFSPDKRADNHLLVVRFEVHPRP